jgi:putative ABC transport system ATP-binding protein
MSSGQQQRVGIARALTNNPHLMLADETTSELDSHTACEILSLFRAIVETECITVLMTSHEPLVDRYVDEILLLKDGSISVPDGVKTGSA